MVLNGKPSSTNLGNSALSVIWKVLYPVIVYVVIAIWNPLYPAMQICHCLPGDCDLECLVSSDANLSLPTW